MKPENYPEMAAQKNSTRRLPHLSDRHGTAARQPLSPPYFLVFYLFPYLTCHLMFPACLEYKSLFWYQSGVCMCQSVVFFYLPHRCSLKNIKCRRSRSFSRGRAGWESGEGGAGESREGSFNRSLKYFGVIMINIKL